MAPSQPPAPADDEDEPPHHANVEAVRLRERIYATITMVAVVVALAEDRAITLPDAVWTIVGTAVGIWLATLVADQQSFRVVRHRMARGPELRTMLHTSSPLLLSAASPLVLAGLAALGLMALRTALLVAVWVDLAELFSWGLLGGLRMGAGRFAAVLAGFADLVIGMIIVLVKVIAGH